MTKEIKNNFYRCYKKFIPTPDEWYPTYDDGTVKVAVMLTTNIWKKPSIRVCVWGNDDFGLEKDNFFETPKQARQAYKEAVRMVNQWSIVTHKQLYDLGFIPA